MKIEPLLDRVLVRRVEAESKKGSIHIPDSARDKPQIGEVVAVGPGTRKGGKTGVQPGDLILFGKYSGHTVVLDDVEHLIMRSEEIFGLVIT